MAYVIELAGQWRLHNRYRLSYEPGIFAMKPLSMIFIPALLAGAALLQAVETPPGNNHEKAPQGLSAGNWSSIRAAYEAGRHGFQETEDGMWVARNPGQGWRMEFDGRGFVARPDEGGWEWGLELAGYGRAQRKGRGAWSGFHSANRNRHSVIQQNRLSIQRDPLMEEWFINDVRGLEQGWTVKGKPAGEGEVLRLELAVRGSLSARVTGESVAFLDQTGGTILTYGGLKAWDAQGRDLAVKFAANGRSKKRFVLEVAVAGAVYPVTIDPLAQRAYLKASNTEGQDWFGSAVAVSGDTVVVGAPGEDSSATGVNGNEDSNGRSNSGAAYVFVRDGNGNWSQHSYLKASNVSSGDGFGSSVAVDGDTVVVGAPWQGTTASNSGAVYVFVRDGGGNWSQQAFLKASNAGTNDYFGTAVAVSGDTIVAGAPYERSNSREINGDGADNSAISAGAAYVFVRDGTTWSQEAYLKASNSDAWDKFGESVAVDGDTAVVGAAEEDSNATGINGTGDDPSTDFNSGAVYVFVRNGGTWSQQAYLKASNTDAWDQFGASVAVSGDTVVAGAPGEASRAKEVNGDQEDNSAGFAGAAYVFARSGTTWSQQAYLKASNAEEGDVFGYRVALSGNIVAVQAVEEASNAKGINGNQANNSMSEAGAVYVFARWGTMWRQRAYLKASDTKTGGVFGIGLAVSEDTVVAGSNSIETAYLFDLLPIVPLQGLAKKAQPAPAPADTAFNTFGAAFVNGDGEALFEAGLSGKGAKGGKNRGLFSTLGGSTSLVLHHRQDLTEFGAGYAGLQVNKLSGPLVNQAAAGLFLIQLRGTGVNAASKSLLAREDGADVSPLFRSGSALAELSGAAVASFREVLHAPGPVGYSALSYLLKKDGMPANPVTAQNDSGLLLLGGSGNVLRAEAREGNPAFGEPGAGHFGQFTGRAAAGGAGVAHFGAAFAPAAGGKALQGLFWANQAGGEGRTTLQGEEAPGTDGALFRSFTGLSVSGFEGLYRAAVQGGGAKAADNEGIWRGDALWLRKGVTDLGGGLVAKRIVKFWPVGNDRLAAQVVLSGPKGSGLTSKNNSALMLRLAGGSWQTLLRAGDAAPGAPESKVGKIQAVEVNPESGVYAVLGSLVAGAKSANQMLWVGNAGEGTEEDRLPVRRLRKGDYYDTNETAAGLVKALGMKPAVDKSGAGGRGLGQVAGAWGDVVVTITGDKKALELVVTAGR